MGHEVIRATISALAVLVSCAAAAQELDSIDLLPGAGIGFDFIGTADSDHVQRRRARLVSVLDFASPYKFSGVAAGTEYFKQNGWSARGYSATGIFEDRNRATGAGISATLGLIDIDGHTRGVADAVVNHRFSEQTGGELVLQSDMVATRAALDAGVTHAFVAASVDHAFADRWTGIVLVGGQHFSDGNDRAHLRGWLIYSLLPEYGVSLQARARGYDSSRPGGPFYFNPDRYENADFGLRLRKAIGEWRLYALIAAGEERIDRTTTKPTRFAQLNADRVLTEDIRIGVRYAYSRAAGEVNESAGAGPNYHWHYLRFFLVAPL